MEAAAQRVYILDEDALLARFKQLTVILQNRVRLEVKTDEDSVWFYENEKLINTIPKRALPEHWILIDGILHRKNKVAHWMGGNPIEYVKAEQG